MSSLPPPPPPSGGWPQQPQPPANTGWPGAAPGAPAAPPGAPGGYGAPPGQVGPWGSPMSYQPTGGAFSAEKAGFWQRFGGWFIDYLIVLLFYVPAAVMLFTGPTEEETCRVDADGDIVDFSDEPDNAICEVPSGATVAMAGGLFLVGIAAGVIYHSRMTGRTGQTIGAKAVGIRVVDIRTGQPIGTGRAFGRYLAGTFISSLICYLGFFWMLWDDQKQTWHDKMTSSVVIKT